MADIRPVQPGPARFSPQERRLLLAEPRIGQRVVDRLEQAGLHSLAQMRGLGVARVLQLVCSNTSALAWANRRRPLERAMARSIGHAGP